MNTAMTKFTIGLMCALYLGVIYYAARFFQMRIKFRKEGSRFLLGGTLKPWYFQ